MKVTSLTIGKLIQNSKFWLLGILVGLVAVQLSLTGVIARDIDFLGISLLFWVAVLFLLWQKRDTLRLESDSYSRIAGILLIAWVLLRSAFLSSDSRFLLISPFISALGVGLLASGVKRLKQYIPELLLLLVLAIPVVGCAQLIEQLIHVTMLTAKFATFVLETLRFPVVREGLNIILPTGGVNVYSGCSGLRPMLELLRLAILVLVMFPTDRSKKILVPVVAVCLAFVVNGIRIALLTVLSARNQQEAFDYFHMGDGSHIFPVISMLLFGMFCHYLIQPNTAAR